MRALRALQKKRDFWMVLNRPEIRKNRLEKGPDDFFWTVLNRPGQLVGICSSGWFGKNRPQLQTVLT
jgi:hypothetical protein